MKRAKFLSFIVLFSLCALCACVTRNAEYVCPDGSVVSDTSLCPADARGIVCNKPYIRMGTGCCLDRNDNSVCDGDEGLPAVSSTTFDYKLEVTTKERRNLTISKIAAKDADERKVLEFTAHYGNGGNVELYPRIHIDILEQGGNGSDVLKSIDYSNKVLPPMSEKDVNITVVNDLLPGDYLARFMVYLDNQTLSDARLSFTVRPSPDVPQGHLIRVEVDKVWAIPGDTVKLTAFYKNDGFVKTSAVFKGRVAWNDNDVATFESDAVAVPSGGDAQLSVNYVPKYPGRYILSGNVYYGGKVTSEKSTILNVKPK